MSEGMWKHDRTVLRRKPYMCEIRLVSEIPDIRFNKPEVVGMAYMVISDVNGIDYLSGSGD